MRPLHAVRLPAGRQLIDLLARALDGGPAVLPLDPTEEPGLTARTLAALRPHAVVDADGVHPLPDPADLDERTAVVVQSSGSAGTPKGVELSAAALRHSARSTLDHLAATPGRRWLCCLPVHHVAGLQVLVRSLLAGSDPVLASGPGPDADFVSLVPTQLQRALDAGLDLSGYHAVLLGGAAPPPTLLARAAARGVRVVVTYGMSETSGGAVYDGLPLAGVQVAVDDNDAQGRGRIRIGGPTLAHGYRLDPAATRSGFVDGWHRTQDAGRLDADGRLTVLGRLDDVVVTGGVNVSLLEVAGAVAGHPAVAEAAAFARPDPEWGQRIVAVVVARGAAPGLAELREHVRATAGAAAAPRELLVVTALPALPGGKLDRRALAGLGPR